MKTPRLVIFDVGQVVIRLDWEQAFAAWSASSGVDRDSLAECLVSDDTFLNYERGALTDQQFVRHACDKLGMTIADDAFVAGWNAIFREPIAAVIEWLASLSGRQRIVALSNTNAIHERHLRANYSDVLALFDHLYLSNHMDARKPESACFQAVLQAEQVDAEQCLFFDDLADNVAAARRLGINATQVTSALDVTQVLHQHFPNLA